MGFLNTIYTTVFRRTSTSALALIMGAFFFERAFDDLTVRWFEYHNEGKLWKHIKHNYEK